VPHKWSDFSSVLSNELALSLPIVRKSISMSHVAALAKLFFIAFLAFRRFLGRFKVVYRFMHRLFAVGRNGDVISVLYVIAACAYTAFVSRVQLPDKNACASSALNHC